MDIELPSSFRLAKIARNHSNFIRPAQRMGAVIVKSGRVIAFGFNQSKTHTLFPKAYSFHAEMHAIVTAQTDLVGADIYIYRERNGNQPAMAKPCDMCLKLIIESGINKIFYTVSDNPLFYEVIK